MKAIAFDSYGPPGVLQLTDLPDPESWPNQVRVRIKTAGVQPANSYLRNKKVVLLTD